MIIYLDQFVTFILSELSLYEICCFWAIKINESKYKTNFLTQLSRNNFLHNFLKIIFMPREVFSVWWRLSCGENAFVSLVNSNFYSFENGIKSKSLHSSPEKLQHDAVGEARLCSFSFVCNCKTRPAWSHKNRWVVHRAPSRAHFHFLFSMHHNENSTLKINFRGNEIRNFHLISFFFLRANALFVHIWCHQPRGVRWFVRRRDQGRRVGIQVCRSGHK